MVTTTAKAYEVRGVRGQYISIRGMHGVFQTWTDRWNVKFRLLDDMENIGRNLDNVIRDYLEAPDGEHAIKRTQGNFDWTDAIAIIPDAMWAFHGFERVKEADLVIRLDATTPILETHGPKMMNAE